MTIKKQLSRMPYSELLAFIECNDVIEGFDYEVDKDGVCSVIITYPDGKQKKYNQATSTYDFVVSEAISRLSALPHIKLFALKRYKGNFQIIPTRYNDKFDFLVAGLDENENKEIGMKMYRIEIKCREKELYTKEYFEREGILVDLDKQPEAEVLYTQSADGYGFFHNMVEAYETGETVTKKTTAVATDEKERKDVCYFKVSDAIEVLAPFESETINEYNEELC